MTWNDEKYNKLDLIIFSIILHKIIYSPSFTTMNFVGLVFFRLALSY